MRLDRITTRLAFVALASTGLLVAHMGDVKSLMGRDSVPKDRRLSKSYFELLEESETSLDLSRLVDISAAESFWSANLRERQMLYLFRNGTCVLVDEQSENPLMDALEAMGQASEPDTHFLTRKVANDAYLVSLGTSVFTFITAEKLDVYREKLETEYVEFLTSTDMKSVPADLELPFDDKVGLAARRLMNFDSRELKIAKVIKASERFEIVGR